MKRIQDCDKKGKEDQSTSHEYSYFSSLSVHLSFEDYSGSRNVTGSFGNREMQYYSTVLSAREGI